MKTEIHKKIKAKLARVNASARKREKEIERRAKQVEKSGVKINRML